MGYGGLYRRTCDADGGHRAGRAPLVIDALAPPGNLVGAEVDADPCFPQQVELSPTVPREQNLPPRGAARRIQDVPGSPATVDQKWSRPVVSRGVRPTKSPSPGHRRVRAPGWFETLRPMPISIAPMMCFQKFGQNPTELSSIHLQVVGPTDAERAAAEIEFSEGVDHRDSRGEGEPRFMFDRQSVNRRIDHDSKRKAVVVGPPLIAAPAPAAGLGACPHQKWQFVAASRTMSAARSLVESTTS